MAGLTKKGKTYYALFSLDGKTKWQRIGNIPYKDALKVLKNMEAEFDKERVGLKEIKPINFIEYASIYLDYSKANKAYNSWRRDNTSIRALSSYFGNVLLNAIENQDIELYKAYRQREGIKSRSINLELLCLSNMLRKAIEWNYLKNMSKIKLLKQVKKPPRFLSKEEIEMLLESSSLWLRLILIVLRNSGLRTCELVNLRLEDIDFLTNTMIVRNQKGNDYHTISMNEELRTTLLFLGDNYVTPQGKILARREHRRVYVFCNPDGQPIKSFRTSLIKAVSKSGLHNVTPHTLRHTFASHLVMNGVDLTTVQHLLGHKSISTTLIYAHLSSEHIARAVEKLSWAKPELKLARE